MSLVNITLSENTKTLSKDTLVLKNQSIPSAEDSALSKAQSPIISCALLTITNFPPHELYNFQPPIKIPGLTSNTLSKNGINSFNWPFISD